MRKYGNAGKWFWELLAALICLIVLVPSYLIIINSFKDVAGAAELSISFPKKWEVFANYSKVFKEAHILHAYWNTFVITFVSVVGIIFLCSTSAYIIQRRNDLFCRIMRFVFLVGMILPLSIIPTYILFHKMHLTGGYWGIILLYIATSYPFITYIYTGFFDGISKELDEAASIDGASGIGLFRRVIFPLLMPINATAMIISVMLCWNDFNLSLYFLSAPKLNTLALTIYFFFGQHTSDWNLVFADLIIISLPVVVLYLFLQRFIISGLTAGAVKS